MNVVKGSVISYLSVGSSITSDLLHHMSVSLTEVLDLIMCIYKGWNFFFSCWSFAAGDTTSSPRSFTDKYLDFLDSSWNVGIFLLVLFFAHEEAQFSVCYVWLFFRLSDIVRTFCLFILTQQENLGSVQLRGRSLSKLTSSSASSLFHPEIFVLFQL